MKFPENELFVQKFVTKVNKRDVRMNEPKRYSEKTHNVHGNVPYF